MRISNIEQGMSNYEVFSFDILRFCGSMTTAQRFKSCWLYLLAFHSKFDVGRSTCPQCLWVVFVECPGVLARWQWSCRHRLWCMAGGCWTFIPSRVQGYWLLVLWPLWIVDCWLLESILPVPARQTGRFIFSINNHKSTIINPLG